MTAITESRYRYAPPAAVDQLRRFRATHPLKSFILDGVTWDYLLGGQGRETLLILPGLLGVAEMSFQHSAIFENTYRVIVPGYPFGVGTLDQLVGGLAALLDAEQIDRVHVLGGSFGGLVAQRFVRAYPERVRRLVLSHTGGPRPDRARANRRAVTLFGLLPMRVLRFMLRGATRRSLRDAPEHIAFWEAYSDEMITRLTKADLISRYRLAADFDATSTFTPVRLHGSSRSWMMTPRHRGFEPTSKAISRHCPSRRTGTRTLAASLVGAVRVAQKSCAESSTGIPRGAVRRARTTTRRKRSARTCRGGL